MDDDLVDVSVARATALLRDAQRLTTRRERREAQRLAALLADSAGRELLLGLTDRVMRIPEPHVAAEVFAEVAEGRAPVGSFDRVALAAGRRLATVAPQLVLPAVRWRIRRQTGSLVLPLGRGERRALARLRADGARVNVNVLGELVLGDDEATQRTAAVIDQLQRPDVDYVSVKISALCAQLQPLAFEHTLERICTRLREVFTAAAAQHPAAFVNLDMEEHRDLELTTAAFRQVLDEPAFHRFSAGIVLQAYLPESFATLQAIATWAAQRHRAGGAAIKVRIVKGANLAMERVDAELHGWQQAPYATKHEVDSNYKRMVEHALRAGSAGGLRVGVASHNLFDVAWAIELAEHVGAADRLDVEMLNGMAPGQARAVAEHTGGVLLYAPVVRPDDFPSAISYLARRLDENSAPENYLSHALTIDVGNPQWQVERERFTAAVRDRHAMSAAARRDQDRATEHLTFPPGAPFTNTPDTDFAIAANRCWIERHLRTEHGGRPLPAEVDDTTAIDAAVVRGREAGARWAARALGERIVVLLRAAEVMASGRGRSIATMVHEATKTVGEADVEVSEAVDFARYYAESAQRLGTTAHGALLPRGLVAVVPPWNFPYAIPAGGVLAALAAGNAVILKPAPQTVRTAWALTEQLWEAGVPSDLLQFVRAGESTTGRHLVTHPGVDTVVLTGSFDTAALFLGWKPDLHLLAETSGKNAIVVTEHADIDLAVADIVRSAFGHAGQKCSAASLAIVTAPVHDGPHFVRKLADATRSLRVGPADDPATVMGPLIGPPPDVLRRALTMLDAGERWLVEPTVDADDPRRWTPGIRTGVAPGSWFHRTECFGPVLGVIRADDLAHAIELQNAVSFGLTGGLHSLDPDEISRWLGEVQVGNAYVNRHITGAIVRRQPFGGWKRSAVGPTAKAGGPDYVAALGRWRDAGDVDPDTVEARYREWWLPRRDRGEDPSGLTCERNELRYHPLPRPVILRVGDSTAPDQVQRAIAAAAVIGTEVEVSSRGAETDEDLADRIGGCSRLRLLTTAGDALRRAAHRANVPVDDEPIAAEPSVELPRWLRAQAVSETLHRYGNVRTVCR